MTKTIDKTKEYFQRFIVKYLDTHNRPLFIEKVVSEFYNLSIDDLRSKSRKGNIPIARGVYAYLMKEEKQTLSSVSELFNKNHATMTHMVGVVTRERKNDIKEIKTIINNHLNSTNYEYNSIG
tara:strand:- start:876 stop:1244 length:369 start_codon:yes stop_codon:yes gene_type:complete